MSEHRIAPEQELGTLLHEQGRQVRHRDRVRLAAGWAFIPVAMACSAVLSQFGGSGPANLFTTWLLIMLVVVLMIGSALWWMAGIASSSVPRWPRPHHVARIGGVISCVVVALTVILLARTQLLASVLLLACAATSGGALWRYDQIVDARLSNLNNRILAEVGYR